MDVTMSLLARPPAGTRGRLPPRPRAAAVEPAAPDAAAPVATPDISPELAEFLQQKELEAGAGDIYGIPREEWLALQSPVRYMGNEFGAVQKPFDEQEVRFTLTYPESYEVGSSNLGHIILYTMLNRADGVMCDRAYFPGADAAALLARHGKPLFGVESKRGLCDFDVLGFSLSYELGGLNILEMLRLSHVPVTSEARAAAEPDGPWDPSQGSVPFAFAGGPTATSNPEPFSAFLDFFALGDGEELLVEIAECLRVCKRARLTRADSLLRLARDVEGVYVPQFYMAPEGMGGAVVPVAEGVPARPVRRVAAPDPFSQVGLIPFVQTVHDRMTIEIRRGCTRGCRFCQPGMLTRPARDVDPDDVVAAVTDGIRKTGYNGFSLLSLSCSDYLALPSVGLQIKNKLRGENVNLSLPSQRVDRFDEDIANVVQGAKKSGLTFAPEAGTQRLRDIVNKGLTNEELLQGVKTAWDQGWKQVKLYFMIGLPGELDEDVLGIAETVRWLQTECSDDTWKLAIHLTISNFTPKPHTPFQWHTVSKEEFERKQALLKEAFEGFQQVKVNYTDTRLSAMEDFIARGDRSLCAVLERAWELGATNDMWWMDSAAAFAAWDRAIDEAGLSWKYRQVEGGEWNSLEHLGDSRFRKQGGGGKGRLDRGTLADARLDAPLPWDHINTGVSKTWLKTDLQRALEAATVPDCSHSGLCSECGVCGDGFGENVVAEAPPIPEFEGHYVPDTRRVQRVRLTFSKTGDMVYVGHLDLLRLLERACRRAALPTSADASPYNPRTRMSYCAALPLGATSSTEIVEVIMTERVDAEGVRAALQAQVPPGLEFSRAEALDVYRLNGSLSESLTVLTRSVTYELTVRQRSVSTTGEEEAAAEEEGPLPPVGDATRAVLAAGEFVVKKETKKKKRKKRVDLRPQVLRMRPLRRPFESQTARYAPAVLGKVALGAPAANAWAVVEVEVALSADGGHLKPADAVRMMTELSGREFELRHVHRSGVDVAEGKPAPLSPCDRIHLSKMCRAQVGKALKRRFAPDDLATRTEERGPFLFVSPHMDVYRKEGVV